MFSAVAYVNVDILAINKSSVLDRNSATVTSSISIRPGTSFTMAVASMHESQPGDPIWLVEESDYGGTRNDVRVVRMDNPASGSPSFTEFLVPVASYTSGNLPDAPQPGGTFNTNDARMLNAEWRDGRLVSTQAVALGGKTVVRWYEFDVTGATPSLTQQGNIDPGPGIATYFPSIAINDTGGHWTDLYAVIQFRICLNVRDGPGVRQRAQYAGGFATGEGRRTKPIRVAEGVTTAVSPSTPSMTLSGR